MKDFSSLSKEEMIEFANNPVVKNYFYNLFYEILLEKKEKRSQESEVPNDQD